MTKVNNIQQTTNNNFKISASNAKGRSVENTLLLLLFVIGIIGTMYFLNQAKSEASTELGYFSSLERDAEGDVNHKLERGKNYLSIFGVQEEGVPLEFAFDHLDIATDYFLDFGDGKKINLSETLAIHTYSKRGTFQVKLLQKKSKKIKLIQERTITIETSSQLVEAMSY